MNLGLSRLIVHNHVHWYPVIEVLAQYLTSHFLLDVFFDDLDDFVLQLISINLLKFRLLRTMFNLFLQSLNVLTCLVNVVKHLLLLDCN